MTDSQDTDQAKKIIVTGFGGQGIILAGKILGKAAALGDHRESTLVESYGPESRGGSCSAQVIISDRPIYYPYVKQPDILVCMSQSGYEKFITTISKKSLLLIDRDLVQPARKLNMEYFAIPATRKAEELGKKMMANIIMMGFAVSITGVVSQESAHKAVMGSVPKGTEKLNTEAFSKGYDYGIALLKRRFAKKAAAQATGAIL